jgi:hypothetical protein
MRAVQDHHLQWLRSADESLTNLVNFRIKNFVGFIFTEMMGD